MSSTPIGVRMLQAKAKPASKLIVNNAFLYIFQVINIHKTASKKLSNLLELNKSQSSHVELPFYYLNIFFPDEIQLLFSAYPETVFMIFLFLSKSRELTPKRNKPIVLL